MREVEIAKVYRHFKGNYYYVLGLAEHTEKYDILVIYHALYDEGDTYARPMDIFLEKAPEDKENPTGQRHRFELVEQLDRDVLNKTYENNEKSFGELVKEYTPDGGYGGRNDGLF